MWRKETDASGHRLDLPPSNELGTNKTVKTKLWTCLESFLSSELYRANSAPVTQSRPNSGLGLRHF